MKLPIQAITVLGIVTGSCLFGGCDSGPTSRSGLDTEAADWAELIQFEILCVVPEDRFDCSNIIDLDDPKDSYTVYGGCASVALVSDTQPVNGLVVLANAEAFSRTDVPNLPSGTYYVKVFEEGGQGELEAYDISIFMDAYEPDNDWTLATVIGHGESQVHRIAPVRDEDWLQFTLVYKSDILIETSCSFGSLSMWLYDTDLNELPYTDDGGLERQIEASDLPIGTYYVKVAGYRSEDQIAHYGISLSIENADDYEPDDEPAQASPIAAEETQVHSLAPVGDQDWLQFALDNTSDVVLEATRTNGDVRLWLYDEGLSEVAFADSGERYARIDVADLRSGPYYVKIEEGGGDEEVESCAVFLSVTRPDEHEPDDEQALAAPIGDGETQTRSLTPIGDVDWLKFTLATTSSVVIDGSRGHTSLWLRLYDDGGTEIASSSREVRRSGDILAHIEAADLSAGTYYLNVSEFDNNDVIAAYSISFATANTDKYEPDDDRGKATTISSEEMQTHSIAPAGDRDWLRFTLGTPSNVVIGEEHLAFGHVGVRLYDNELREIAVDHIHGDPGNRYSMSEWYGLAGETYYVEIRQDDEHEVTAVYGTWLSIASSRGDDYEPDDDWPQAAPISAGETQTHSLAPPGDEDWLEFTLSAAANVVIDTVQPSGNVQLQLNDNDLEEVVFKADNVFQIVTRPDSSGRYAILDLPCPRLNRVWQELNIASPDVVLSLRNGQSADEVAAVNMSFDWAAPHGDHGPPLPDIFGPEGPSFPEEPIETELGSLWPSTIMHVYSRSYGVAGAVTKLDDIRTGDYSLAEHGSIEIRVPHDLDPGEHLLEILDPTETIVVRRARFLVE